MHILSAGALHLHITTVY